MREHTLPESFSLTLKFKSCCMRASLLLSMILGCLRTGQSLNGVIWDKKTKNFVPIFSIGSFAKVREQILNESRNQETHNFQGKVVKLSYYEETNIIFSCNNGTGVTGAIGEIWNTLSEFLNFTLKPIYSKENTVGVMNPNGNYTIGLLSIAQRNETDIVPRVEAYRKRLVAVQFSTPLWKTGFRLYIRQEMKHNSSWMLKLFSRKVWYSVLWMYLLLTLCSYLSQVLDVKMHKKARITLDEHFFYNFGSLCGQSCVPENMLSRSRAVEFWLEFFSFLIRTSFGALLIGYMTQTVSSPPFHDMESILHDTSYTVVTANGSLPNIIFQVEKTHAIKGLINAKRNLTVYSMHDLYTEACSTNKLNAIFESEDVKRARGVYICPLNPIGETKWDTWVVSGIARNFEYKRSIDIGILKLHEVGFMQRVKHRWVDAQNRESDPTNGMEPIVMDQVILIIEVFCAGVLLSLVILIFENLTFCCKT